MSENLILQLLKDDIELMPDIILVRETFRYLENNGLALIIEDQESDWLAAKITSRGVQFLHANLSSKDTVDLAIYHPDECYQQQPLTKRKTPNTLPSEIKAWLDQELVRHNFQNYDSLQSLLMKKGYEISRSTLGYYGKKLKDEQKELKQSIEIAKAFTEVVDDDGASFNQALVAVAQHKVLTVLRENKFQQDGIKLPALIRSVASLSRADINNKEYKIRQAERRQAINDAAKAVEDAAKEKGMNQEQVDFWKKKVLGVI